MCGTKITSPWMSIGWSGRSLLEHQVERNQKSQHDQIEAVEVIGKIKTEEGKKQFI